MFRYINFYKVKSRFTGSSFSEHVIQRVAVLFCEASVGAGASLAAGARDRRQL